MNVKEVELLVTPSFPTLCDPMDCGPPGYPVHGILQARTLEWVVMTFSRGSSRTKDRIQVSHIGRQIFTTEPLRKLTSYHFMFYPSGYS